MQAAGRKWRAPVVVMVLAALFALAGFIAGCGASGGEETSPPSASPGVAGERQVIDLVELTRAALEKDTPAVLTGINAAQEPFVDPAQPQLYSYVYDMNVTLVASPDPDVSGQSMKGKPDAVGRLFRDEIVAGALDHGSGWVTYVYTQPGKDGLFQKAAYYKLTEGSDGKLYAVCAGRYLGPFAGTPSPGATAAAAPTQADVQTFVRKALAYAREHGKKAALKAFTAPGGEFRQGELSVYAYDFNGTVIANGGDPTLVGKNLLGAEDPNGVPVVKEQVALAEGGGGWLYYTWPNPAHDNKQEAELGYVLKVDNDWFLGSGTYGPAAIKPPSKAEVEKFVAQAYDYAQAQGREKALAEFSQKDGAFYRGELYIFAYDMSGTCLCLPNEPALVGTNRWDYRDATGKYVVRELVDLARDPGTGWVDYKYANPTQGYAVQPKTSYVRGIDGTWLIAAGTYLPQK